MPGNLAKLVKPTGLEDLQTRAKLARELAEAMDKQSMGIEPVGSWTQVLAKMMAGFVAGRERRQATKLDKQYEDTLSGNFATHHAEFIADKKAGMSDEDLYQKYSGDEYAQADVKPIAESYIAALKTRAEQANTMHQNAAGTWEPGSSLLGVPNIDYNKPVITDEKGNPHINMMRITASRLAGPTGPGFTYTPPGGGQSIGVPAYNGTPNAPAAPTAPTGQVPFTAPNIKTMEGGGQDFINGQPVRSSAGAMYGMQVMPSTAAKPGYGVTPVPPDIMGLPDTDPRKAAAFDQLGAAYAQAMQHRFGANAPAAYNAGPGRVGDAMQYGGPNWQSTLPKETQNYSKHFSRPPDGVAKNGQPYWVVNGEAFDNPEGQ